MIMFACTDRDAEVGDVATTAVEANSKIGRLFAPSVHASCSCNNACRYAKAGLGKEVAAKVC